MSIAAGDRDDGSTVVRPSAQVGRAVQGACQRLYASEQEFVASFHDSLIQLVPQIQVTTPDHGLALAQGLVRSVLWAALTDDPPEVVEATFQGVGAEQYRQGFPADGYHGVGHALLRSARTVYTGEWSSELSSGWVAYYSWLGAHLQEGARRGREAGPVPQHTGPGQMAPLPASGPNTALPAPDPSSAPPARPAPAVRPSTFGSVEEVAGRIRAGYFPGDAHGFAAIATRVALRTGVDLQAPRADQRTDPAAIALVLGVLDVLGYPLAAQPPDLLSARNPAEDGQQDIDLRWPTPRTGRPRGWRRAMPTRFR